MASEEIPPPPYDASVTVLEDHPLKPLIRAVESSDLPMILAHIGTTNPPYMGVTSLSVLDSRLQRRKREDLPYLLLFIPMSIAKILNMSGKPIQCTESERTSGQSFVGVAEVSEWGPMASRPEWRKTLKLGINMPDWSHTYGLPKLLVDAIVEQLSYRHDSPSAKPSNRASLMSRYFSNTKQVIPKPVGDQKKYKNLIMILNIKRNSGNDNGESVPIVPWAKLYEQWGFKQIGHFEDVIEYEGEGYDICYYQRKI